MFFSAVLGTVSSSAQQNTDAPPVNITEVLQTLRALRTQQVAQQKTQLQTALAQVQQGASNPDRALAMWEEAVRTVQFDGVNREAAAFRSWREGEGDALKEPEAANAVRLYFAWLHLTLQRSAATSVKELLPAIMAYGREVTNDQTTIQALEESIRREKELAATHKNRRKGNGDDAAVRKEHDYVLLKPLAGSVVVQWLHIGEFVNPDKWEPIPGNVDGIYQKIVLPELRLERDPRILEYWDMKMRTEGEAAARTKLAFDLDKFNTVRRPALLWNRALDLAVIGQKNRAIGEMLGLVKTYPGHPDAADWLAKLEETVTPPVTSGNSAPAVAPTPVNR